MESDTLVSVIIPVFNVASYLEESLNSVISQSYEMLEIIIIDDGSTDNSGEICDKYAMQDPRIHVIHQKNQGLSGARNTGLELMTGDLVVFFDSDDAYHPDFIKNMVVELQKNNVDLVVCKYTVNSTTGVLKSKSNDDLYPTAKAGSYGQDGALRELAEGSINYSVWNKIYKKKLWENIRYPEGRVYEDIDTMYRVLDSCKSIYVLDLPLYIHRKRQGSISLTTTDKNYYDNLLALNHFVEYIEKHIPDIFTEEQLRRVNKTRLFLMIHVFLLCTSKTKNGFEIKGENIRKQIIATGQRCSFENVGIRTKIAYWMICHNCILLKIISPFYYRARQHIWNLRYKCHV